MCFLLLLHLTFVVSQYSAEGQYVEQVQGEDSAEGQYVEQVQEEGGDEAAGQQFTGCEEGLEYMMFLREDIRLVLSILHVLHIVFCSK